MTSKLDEEGNQFGQDSGVMNCSTPATKSPKAIPKLLQLLMPRDVSAGLQRLPGAVYFDSPSTRITNIIKIVERIPRIEE
jgi:hypothetical protein